MAGEMERGDSVQLDMPDERCFAFAETAGLNEYLVDLGDRVVNVQPIARLWLIDRTGQKPATCTAVRNGILTARHAPGLMKVGDFVALVAVQV